MTFGLLNSSTQQTHTHSTSIAMERKSLILRMIETAMKANFKNLLPLLSWFQFNSLSKERNSWILKNEKKNKKKLFIPILERCTVLRISTHFFSSFEIAIWMKKISSPTTFLFESTTFIATALSISLSVCCLLSVNVFVNGNYIHGQQNGKVFDVRYLVVRM